MSVELFDYRSPPSANTTGVQIGDLRLYFSYKTVVAFHDPEMGAVVSKNIWGNTTGRHLGLISAELNVPKSSRYDRERFVELLDEVLQRLGLSDSL